MHTCELWMNLNLSLHFLSFKEVYTISYISSKIKERKRAMKDCCLTYSLWYFHLTLTWVLRGYILENLSDEKEKSLYFRLHYMLPLIRDILSVCGYFWMQELMRLPKMWDGRKIILVKRESVNMSLTVEGKIIELIIIWVVFRIIWI